MRIFIILCLLFVAGCSNIEAYLFTTPITNNGDQKKEINRQKYNPQDISPALTIRY